MKKISKICSICIMGIMAMSSIAHAESIDYSFRLPATGSRSTDNAYKETDDRYATNYVDYLGWEGSKINSWVCDNDGTKISVKSSFTGTGSVDMYMGKDEAEENEGAYVYMKIKTSGGTMHKCDINGEFDPS